MPLAVPLQAILIAITVHSLWGGNPVAVKFGLLVFPPLWSAFFRFALGVVCVLTWAYLRGERIWPRRGEWGPLNPAHPACARRARTTMSTCSMVYARLEGSRG